MNDAHNYLDAENELRLALNNMLQTSQPFPSSTDFFLLTTKEFFVTSTQASPLRFFQVLFDSRVLQNAY